jgi:hypothetical protein
MTGQRPEPPALAIRLLHFCVPSQRREALLGDLLEKIRPRQIFTLVLAGSFHRCPAVHRRLLATSTGRDSLCSGWHYIGAIMLRTSWWRIIWQSSTVQSLCGWGVGWPFPLSIICNLSFGGAIFTTPVLVLLAVFWSAKNAWRWAGVRQCYLHQLSNLDSGTSSGGHASASL